MSAKRVAGSVAVPCVSLGAMAFATSANAAVIEVVHDVQRTIPISGGITQSLSLDEGDEVKINLRRDGDAGFISVETKGSNDVFLLDEFGDPNFSALSLIDGSRSSAGERVTLADLGPDNADFGEPDVSGFLGLSVLLNGNTHYAWIEVFVTEDNGSITVDVARSGFEDVAGVGILAGSTESLADIPLPSSLLLLTSGALGLAALRRRRNGAGA